MRVFDRVALLGVRSGMWLDVGTKKQLARRSWSLDSDNGVYRVLPLVLVSFPPWERPRFVEALNRSLAVIHLGETTTNDLMAVAVEEGLDRLYLACWAYCGRFPNTTPPPPPYLEDVDLRPEWASPEAVEALTDLYRSTVDGRP